MSAIVPPTLTSATAQPSTTASTVTVAAAVSLQVEIVMVRSVGQSELRSHTCIQHIGSVSVLASEKTTWSKGDEEWDEEACCWMVASVFDYWLSSSENRRVAADYATCH